MRNSVRISPPNSVVFISDVDGGMAPESFSYAAIMSTDTCIAVGTLMEQSGDTAIRLSVAAELPHAEPPVFEGMLDTPTGQVVVSVVDRTVLLEGRSGQPRTRIRIWTNHPTEPDEIVIAYGD